MADADPDDFEVVSFDDEDEEKDSDLSEVALVKKYFTKPIPRSLHHETLQELGKLDEHKVWLERKFNERKADAPKTLVQTALADKKGIERRLEESDIALSQLIQFGGELVTNVKLANEKREILRRNFEAAKREELLNDLENESNLALIKFDDITSKWEEISGIKEPMSLYEELAKQKERIAELMKQKDAVIKECRDEIERVDQRYYVDQHRQSTDIYSLVERVDNQIELIKFSYNKHLELLQQTIEDERTNVSMAATRKWELLFDKQAENENKRITIIKQKNEFYVSEMARITREQEDITRNTRIRLERDAENLQLELTNIKADILNNSEKLDYNFQVLQKRHEENLIVSNQQKHRVSHINETISTLKKKLRDTKINSDAQIKKLTSEVLKLHCRISELEVKADQFKISNEQKFNTVWDINYAEAIDLLNKILKIDCILHEQQLGLVWEPTYVPSSRKKEFKQKKNLTTNLRILKSKLPSDNQSNVSSSNTKSDKTKLFEQTKIIDNRLLRNVIRKISDRAGFLLDDKLIKLLEPYQKSENTLVRIDNIFTALRIQDIADVHSLMEYFLPYSYCPNCTSGLQSKEYDKAHTVDFDDNEEAKQSISGSGSDSDAIFQLNDAVGSLTSEISVISYESDELDKELHAALEKQGDDTFSNNILPDNKTLKYDEISRKSNIITNKTQCVNHYFLIEPALVLTALREYVEKQLEKRHNLNINQYKSIHSVSISRKDRDSTGIQIPKIDVKSYWAQFFAAFPENKQKLWKSLEHGLNHFYDTLRMREKLDQECEFLRRQNAELRFLLQKYLPPKTN